MIVINFSVPELDAVLKTFDFGREELAALHLGSDASVFPICHYIAHMLDMVCKRVPVDDHVVNVDVPRFPLYLVTTTSRAC